MEMFTVPPSQQSQCNLKRRSLFLAFRERSRWFAAGCGLWRRFSSSGVGTSHLRGKLLAWIFMVVSLYAFAAMVIARELVIPSVFPAAVAGNIPGDPDYYHRLALERVEAIREGGISELQLRPEGQGPAGLASLVYLVNPSPYSFVLINALSHGLSALMMAMLVMRWFSVRAALVAIAPLVISPYMMVWFSQLNKDSLVLSGVLMLVYGLVRFVTAKERVPVREGMISLLFMGGGVVLLWTMRPYLNQVLLPIIAVLLVFSLGWRAMGGHLSFSGGAVFALYGLILIACLGVLGQGAASSETIRRLESFDFDIDGAVGNEASGYREGKSVAARCLDRIKAEVWRDENALPDYVNRKLRAMMGQRCLTFTLLETQKNSTVLKSMVDVDRWPAGSLEALGYLPRALMLGFFAPWPDDWSYVFRNGPSFFYMVVPLEAFLLYAGLLGLGFWAWRTRMWVTLISLFLSVGVSLAYGMTTPFLGVLYRYRFPFWIIIICLGIAAMMDLRARRGGECRSGETGLDVSELGSTESLRQG